MRLNLDQTEANLIRAWEGGRLRVGERWYSGHLIVAADRVIEDWTRAAPTDIALIDLQPALAMDPQIIVLGTGHERVLPDVELMGRLAEMGIGIEIMSTPAACRTYNVLVHEARQVVAALLTTPPDPTR